MQFPGSRFCTLAGCWGRGKRGPEEAFACAALGCTQGWVLLFTFPVPFHARTHMMHGHMPHMDASGTCHLLQNIEQGVCARACVCVCFCVCVCAHMSWNHEGDPLDAQPPPGGGDGQVKAV